jgi:hypothetical protein
MGQVVNWSLVVDCGEPSKKTTYILDSLLDTNRKICQDTVVIYRLY